MNLTKIRLLRKKTFLSVVFVSIIAISGTLIAQVSSQRTQNIAEISSPSGLRQKPDNLYKPKLSQPDTINFQIIPDDIIYGQVFRHTLK